MFYGLHIKNIQFLIFYQSASYEDPFSYDILGNRTDYGATHNLINQRTEDNKYTNSYDLRGNLTQRVNKQNGEILSLAWNNQNQLIFTQQVKNGNTVFEEVFKYDTQNRRIETQYINYIDPTKNYTRKLIYNNEDIILELDENNQPVVFYIHGAGIDEPLAMLRDINNNGNFESDEIFYYVKNHLNSVTELLDHTGEIYQRYTYSAYGETKIAKHNPNLELVPNRYAYTSREIDEHTGLYYYRARYYNPSTGRFLSPDPIGFAGRDTNLYRYVKNNPIRFRDPTGLLRDPNEIFEDALNDPNSSSGTNDWGNAYQHCLASCMQTAENGSTVAAILGHGFEAVNNMNGQSSEAWAMDVANNKKGRNLGNTCPDKNTTSFNKNKSQKIKKYCQSSCGNTGLTFLDF